MNTAAVESTPTRITTHRSTINPREVYQLLLANLERVIHGQRPALRKLLARSEEHTSELQSLRHLVCPSVYTLSLHDALPIYLRNCGTRLVLICLSIEHEYGRCGVYSNPHNHSSFNH